MAVTAVTTAMAGAINYTVVTDSSADWGSVANSTYFYDKTDKLVHYKNNLGTILEIFSSSSIAVGTTPVTSGTDGRVFFQAGGVIQQDANFTFDNTLKRLTLKAVGTLSTDIPFSVQNSAGTGLLFQATGDGKHSFNMSPNTNFALSIDQTNQNGGISVYSSGQTIFNVAKIAGPVGYMGVLNNGNYSFFTGNSSYFNHSLVVGGNSLTPGARLDVRAQGALSTDIAFRVRNSADTLDILQVRGDTRIIQNITANSATTYAGFNVAGENTDTYVNAVVSGNQPMGVGFRARSGNGGNSITMWTDNGNVSGVGSASSHLWSAAIGYTYFGAMGSNSLGFKFGYGFSTLSNSSGMLGMLIRSGVSTNQSIFTLGTYLGTTTSNPSSTYGGNTLFVANGTAPTATEADSFGLYSADITAGNAAPHFRTENGSIIKLYQQSSAGIATVGDLVTVLQNLGLLS